MTTISCHEAAGLVPATRASERSVVDKESRSRHRIVHCAPMPCSAWISRSSVTRCACCRIWNERPRPFWSNHDSRSATRSCPRVNQRQSGVHLGSYTGFMWSVKGFRLRPRSVTYQLGVDVQVDLTAVACNQFAFDCQRKAPKTNTSRQASVQVSRRIMLKQVGAMDEKGPRIPRIPRIPSIYVSYECPVDGCDLRGAEDSPGLSFELAMSATEPLPLNRLR